MNIWAVCKDAGGTNNLLPIIPALRNAGHEVKLFLHEGGKGETSINALGENFEVVRTAEEVIERHGQPDLLITSMCAGGGVGRDLIPLLRWFGVKTVALQDTWGARLNTDFQDRKYHPDLVAVNDSVGESIVHNAWGLGHFTKVEATGYPRLDAFRTLNRKEAERLGREAYGIEDDLPVILYSGQIWHAGSMLRKIVAVLNNIGEPCHLLTSRHPRMATEAPAEETQMWDSAELYVGSHIKLHTSAKSNTETVLASTVVVGQYTTVLVDAAVLGKQNISLLYPEQGAAEFQREFGGVMEEFPLVSLGCTVRARGDLKLLTSMREAFDNSLGLEDAQAETFRLDGKNTERTVRAILRHM